MKQINGRFVPGIIYELRCRIGDSWHPFYIGETTNAEIRKRQHTSASHKDNRRVYKFIRETLIPNCVEWDLFPVYNYGEEGPTDQEHEHIMALLYDGVKLTNMKKGSDVWMQQQMEIAQDMRCRGIRSHKKYQQAISQEALDRKHAKWVQEQQEKNRQQRNREMLDKIEQKQREANSIQAEQQRKKAEQQARRAAELDQHRRQQQLAWEKQQQQVAETQAEQHRLSQLPTRAEQQAAELFRQDARHHIDTAAERQRIRQELHQARIENARYMKQQEQQRKAQK